MLVDMRWQFACMLADTKLIGGNPRSSKGRDWMDDAKQAFNVHANKQAVVRLHASLMHMPCTHTSLREQHVQTIALQV